MQIFNFYCLIIWCSFILISFQFILHNFQLQSIFSILKLNTFVKLIFCCLSLFSIFFLKLYILLLINFSFDKFITTVSFNVLLNAMFLSLLTSDGFLYFRSVCIGSCIWWFTGISLIITLWHLSTFLIPLNVGFISSIVDWKLKLWLCLCSNVIILFWLESIMRRFDIFDIMCIKSWHLYSFSLFTKSLSFINNRFIDFINSDLAKSLFIETSC